MSFSMHTSGIRFIAGLLAGSSRKINYMYVEYGTKQSGSCLRTREYFDSMENNASRGFVRIPVTVAYVSDDLVNHFDGLVAKSDIGHKVNKTAFVTSVTLVSGTDNAADDILIATVNFDTPVHLMDDAYTTIHTSLKLGA